MGRYISLMGKVEANESQVFSGGFRVLEQFHLYWELVSIYVMLFIFLIFFFLTLDCLYCTLYTDKIVFCVVRWTCVLPSIDTSNFNHVKGVISQKKWKHLSGWARLLWVTYSVVRWQPGVLNNTLPYNEAFIGNMFFSGFHSFLMYHKYVSKSV